MDRMNVLLMMCDQLNPAVLSCYGGPVPTPHMDRLASEGVLFTNATTPYPVCSPARASLVTGKFPHAHRIVHNVFRRDYPTVPSPESEEGIKNSDLTVDQLFYQQGYDTHHYGKWHLLDEDLPYYPDMYTEHDAYAKDMQDVFSQIACQDRERWMDWYGWKLPVERTESFQHAISQRKDILENHPYAELVHKIGKLKLPVEQTFDYQVADKTIEQIRKQSHMPINERSPFMITCSFNYPHDPNVVPSPYYEMFDPDHLTLPLNFHCEQRFLGDFSRMAGDSLGEAGMKEFLRVYYASVKFIDDQMGRILQCVREQGMEDKTLIVFTADHGDMTGGHGMVLKSTSAFYEEVVRIPLIIKHPNLSKAEKSAVAVCLTDLMPTLLDACGINLPSTATLQGRSILPALCGEMLPDEAFVYTYSERIPANPRHTRDEILIEDACYMVRGNGYKYIEYPDGQRFLYDLKQDPGEVDNVWDRHEYRSIVEHMSRALLQWQIRTSN
jgi:arylsulfatase A-like enzyme